MVTLQSLIAVCRCLPPPNEAGKRKSAVNRHHGRHALPPSDDRETRHRAHVYLWDNGLLTRILSDH